MPLAKDLLVFDIEATGTSVDIYDLVQLGAVKVCKSCFKILDEFMTYARPLNPWKVNKRSMNIHKISMEFLLTEAPSLEEALINFEDFLGPQPKSYMPTTWGSWDITFLMGTYAKVPRVYPLTGKNFDAKSIVCWEYSKGKKNYASGGLQRMSQKLGLPPMEKRHDALADAIRTAELLAKVWPKIRCRRHK